MTDPLIVDAYKGDGVKDWQALANAGLPWAGVIDKVAQGTQYGPSWFGEQLKILSAVCPERNGTSWFFGGYDYLDFTKDGVSQADYFLALYEAALLGAGLTHDSPGLLPVMGDVERGGQTGGLTKSNVQLVTSAWSARIYSATGRRPTLYGGELLYSLGITDHMGCGRLAIARYAPTLPETCVTRIGWTEAELLLWQYCGTDPQTPDQSLHGYPLEAPGCGRVDISAAVRGLESLSAP